MKKEVNKKRILEISLVSHNTGGVEKFLFDVFKHIDVQGLAIDFLSPDGGSYDPYKNDMVSKGANLLDLGIDRVSAIDKLRYNHRLSRFLKTNRYDVIHINSGAFFFCLQVAAIAKYRGVRKVIVHSHNAVDYKGIKKSVIGIFKPLLEQLSDTMLTCSKEAALSLFTHKSVEDGKVVTIKNGIEIDEYKFDASMRKTYRTELGLGNNLVFGHIGRFEKQKNHEHLIDVFYEIQKMHENSMLLLMGEGPLKESIREKVETLGIDGKVRFLGYRNDINRILNALDGFIFPSIYEGLSIVAIEVQTNGLPIYASSELSAETKVSDLFSFIPLEKTAGEWAQLIIDDMGHINTKNRLELYKMTIKGGFDIQATADAIREIYLQ